MNYKDLSIDDFTTTNKEKENAVVRKKKNLLPNSSLVKENLEVEELFEFIELIFLSTPCFGALRGSLSTSKRKFTKLEDA